MSVGLIVFCSNNLGGCGVSMSESSSTIWVTLLLPAASDILIDVEMDIQIDIDKDLNLQR